MPKPPHWIPWLGPVAAVAAGVAVARVWLGGGFWVTLGVALACGFAPIVGYRVWKLLHHKKTD